MITTTFVLVFYRHNDLPWNIRKYIHNNLDRINLTQNVKYIDPWSKSPWSHTDIQRMREGLIGCQVSFSKFVKFHLYIIIFVLYLMDKFTMLPLS